MKTQYFLSIPKPCHENWSEMTANEKGRFCNSCSKTVVDFTKMNPEEVQSYIDENKHQRICGHIKQSQLSTINLQISDSVFQTHMSFHKLFLIALLLAMGTTLFNCADHQGQTKRITSVEMVKNVFDTTRSDDLRLQASKVVCSTTSTEIDSSKTKNSSTTPEIVRTGEIIDVVVGIMIPEKKPTDPFNIYEVDELPRFKGTPRNLNLSELKKIFQTKISNHCSENFNLDVLKKLNLSGRQKIYLQFTIDKVGHVINIKTRASHISIENEAERVIKLLPQFIPAKHGEENVNTIYNLPIQFNIED